MRRRLLAAGAVTIALIAARPHAAVRVPVLVELFTSEGCSSCPAADDVLARLVATQPVDHADIIALGEHVDYWDRQGWRDPFSSSAFTARQSDYDAKVFRSGNIYTPQLVVGGRDDMIGSDARRATNAIASAAKSGARVTVVLTPDAAADGRVTVTVQTTVSGAPLKEPADVLVAITEDGLVSHVRAGENSGRELHHVAVVRTLGLAGTLDPSERSWSRSIHLDLDPSWHRDRLHIVGFVQDRQSKAVLGAAQTSH